MMTRKRLRFSASTSRYGEEDVSEIEKLNSMHAASGADPAAAEVEEPKEKKIKKKKKKKSKLIWGEEDELKILKGLIDCGAKNPQDFDCERFFGFAQRSISINVSEKQMWRKIGKLKRDFLRHERLINQGNDPLFTRCSDSQIFGYGSILWSGNGDESAENGGGGETSKDNAAGEPVNENAAENMESLHEGGETSKDNAADEPVNENGAENMELLHEGGEETLQAGNADEPVNENGVEETTENGVEETTENGVEETTENGFEETTECRTIGAGDEEETLQADDTQVDIAADEPVNENGPENMEPLQEERREDGDDDDDEFCSLRGAIETTILKGLGENQKKFQLEKLMRNITSGQKRQLNDEWNELSAERVRLNIKKLRFTAMVAEAANI